MEEAIGLVVGQTLQARKGAKNLIIRELEQLLQLNLEELLKAIQVKFDWEKSLINYQSEDFQTMKPYIMAKKDLVDEDLKEFSEAFSIDTKWFNNSYCRQRIDEAVLIAKRFKVYENGDGVPTKPRIFGSNAKFQSTDHKLSNGVLRKNTDVSLRDSNDVQKNDRVYKVPNEKMRKQIRFEVPEAKTEQKGADPLLGLNTLDDKNIWVKNSNKGSRQEGTLKQANLNNPIHSQYNAVIPSQSSELFLKKPSIAQCTQRQKESSQSNLEQKENPEILDSSGDYKWRIHKSISLSKASNDDINHIILLKRVIHCYFYVIKKSLKADIPKYISKYLIQDTLTQLKDRLYKAYDEDENKTLLVVENDDIQQQRARQEAIVKQMTIAKEKIIATKNYYLED